MAGQVEQVEQGQRKRDGQEGCGDRIAVAKNRSEGGKWRREEV